MDIALIIVAALVLGGLIFMLIYTYPISVRVYREQLVRTEADKWGRVCSAPDNEEQMAMWEAGNAWAQQYRDRIREVQITHDGLDLYGEYFDFGGHRCVLILPGRCECLRYSYYFADPYRAAGLNVLVVDTRCHGKSGGVYNTIGVKEAGDVLAWSRFIVDELGCDEVWYHGICIGMAAGIFAIVDKDCPAEVRGFINDGCFVTFRETFKRHMIQDHRPRFPVLDLVMLHIWRHTGTNVYRQTPLSVIDKIPSDKRVLFLYGELDAYSIPRLSRRLFAACSATDKRISWFPRGCHSHLRLNNTPEYDGAIIDFLKENA